MSEPITNEQKHAALFMNVVMSFQAAAMQFMGTIKNPITDKVEKDIDQARMYIDMLDMLEAKTKNNLTTEEDGYLKQVISQLKMEFVKASNNG